MIVGAGVAGVEAMLALRELGGERSEVEVLSPSDRFEYRPLAVTEPFGGAEVPSYDLEELCRAAGASFRRQSAVRVDAEAHRVALHDGAAAVHYDRLLVAIGARPLQAVPGVTTFWPVSDEGAVSTLIERAKRGEIERIAFVMSSGCGWPLAAYELALLTAAEVEASSAEVSVLVVTSEDAPLAIFGVRASNEVGQLLADRGVEVRAGVHPVSFDGSELEVIPGEPVRVDAAVGIPRLEGRRLEGVPHDEDGFVPIDDQCRVPGLEDVFAAGDVAAFPVKQGGVAAQQADVVAEAIAAEAWGLEEPSRFEPELIGTLLTGEAPQRLSGSLTGGHGETSEMVEQPGLRPEAKVSSRRLQSFLESLRRD